MDALDQLLEQTGGEGFVAFGSSADANVRYLTQFPARTLSCISDGGGNGGPLWSRRWKHDVRRGSLPFR